MGLTNDDSESSWPSTLRPETLDRISSEAPFLALDPTVITDRHRELTGLVPGLRLFYAVKCNSSEPVLLTVADAGGGFEIASAYELTQLASLDLDLDQVLYSNPVKPPAHIQTAYHAGVDRFAFDSEPELRKIAALAPSARVYVRLTVPDGGSLFPLSKKFGASVEQATRLLALARYLGLVPYGITFHVGSQCTNPESWRVALSRCATVMRVLLGQGIKLEMVDLGGGFPARYVDPVPPIGDIAAAIVDGVSRLPYVPRVLCAEPGRYLVAESGVLATHVIGVEERDGEPWAYLDVGGYNGLMEPLQTGGHWHFPLATCGAQHWSAARRSFSLTGPSCDSSDTVFHDVSLPETLSVGDRLYIGTAGAYTLSYASSFNGFPPPKPFVVESSPVPAG